jgi:uncharacterized protein (DUF2132 family)
MYGRASLPQASACFRLSRRIFMQREHPNDPLHGITLEKLLTELVGEHGWDGLADRIPVRCFQYNPSIQSSLIFLRKTPWARQKVEGLYLDLLHRRQS